MADLNRAISKLTQALNMKGANVLYNKKQFMGKEGKPHNLFTISVAEWDADKHKYISREIYKTTSTARIALFLRDMWFEVNGWELPTDNEMWNQIREANKNG